MIYSSTNNTPLEIVEGRSKVPPLLRTHGKIFAADKYVHDLQSAFQKVKDAIQYFEHKQNLVAHKHRRAITFKVDDWVLLKLPKARLQHTSEKSWQGEKKSHQKYYTKLARRYHEPFQIQELFNDMTYKLRFHLIGKWHEDNLLQSGKVLGKCLVKFRMIYMMMHNG